ncbi:unnamed protein product [Auanema sp. JU1783]|nr:unnamed protein product [Auanema sp. JU1783]
MHQHRPMSQYPALLEPAVCRRRQLPPTPVQRRSSSPRILPTPPPLSPDFRCPSAAVLLERRSSGRLLPRPPSTTSSTASPTSAGYSPEPPSQAPQILTPEPMRSLPAYEEILLATTLAEEEAETTEDYEGDEVIDEGETRITASGTSVIVVPESPVIPRIGDFDSFDHVMDTPDGTRSQSSSQSPSIEQLTSKSISDCEDPVVHGLDPSLYGPNAPTCVSPSTSEHVPASSSFSGSEPRPSGLGLVYCTLQHFPIRKRLRVSILRIEALAGQLKPELEIHAICRVSIPGMKTGKEQTSEVKRGRDPVFNQEFFFDNVTHEDLDTKSVCVAAYHQGSAKIGKDILIGEALVPLREIRELNTKKEIRVIEEIKPQIPKKLGKIYISSSIEKEARRLTINIKKAEDLPRYSFTGAPDVCIKITMSQSNSSKTKSSRVLKSTTTAVYNEAVMFLFDPSKKELLNTKITISVHDMQRTCTGDDIIGCAYLGTLAMDKSEMEQWKNTIEHMGKEYKGTHQLKPQNTAPPVHVAEAGENGVEDED